MKMGVYGSADSSASSKVKRSAREIGKHIARRGHILITGACPGLPYQAVLGARELGGQCIGFSPATNLARHLERDHYPTEGFSELIFVPKSYVYANDSAICKKYRNVSSVAQVDAAIIIRGGTGTMNEFTICYDLGKNVGILQGSGGITTQAIKVLLKNLDRHTGSRVIYDFNPISLIDRLIEL